MGMGIGLSNSSQCYVVALHSQHQNPDFGISDQFAGFAARGLTIESLIRQNNSAGRPTVLGLPTGSTPLGIYRELIRLHKENKLDFSQVITFNLDEYYPMGPTDPQCYRRWMTETFFEHVNLQPQNIHIPDGTIREEEAADFCGQYEQLIRRAGGIDLQLLGIGRTGHVGFNEPGSKITSRTRMVTLDPVTRRDAADGFFGEKNVPHQALTMGVGTILEARKIVILAFGEHKAPIVQRPSKGTSRTPLPPVSCRSIRTRPSSWIRQPPPT